MYQCIISNIVAEFQKMYRQFIQNSLILKSFNNVSQQESIWPPALYGAQCHYRNTDAFYDLVVDTSETTPAEKAELVVDGFARWLDRQR